MDDGSAYGSDSLNACESWHKRRVAQLFKIQTVQKGVQRSARLHQFVKLLLRDVLCRHGSLVHLKASAAKARLLQQLPYGTRAARTVVSLVQHNFQVPLEHPVQQRTTPLPAISEFHTQQCEGLLARWLHSNTVNGNERGRLRVRHACFAARLQRRGRGMTARSRLFRHRIPVDFEMNGLCCGAGAAGHGCGALHGKRFERAICQSERSHPNLGMVGRRSLCESGGRAWLAHAHTERSTRRSRRVRLLAQGCSGMRHAAAFAPCRARVANRGLQQVRFCRAVPAD